MNGRMGSHTDGGTRPASGISSPRDGRDSGAAVRAVLQSNMQAWDDTSEGPAVSDRSDLLPKFDTRPTHSRRLQGVKDLAVMVCAVLPYLVLRATRYVFAWLGVQEHTWRGVANLTLITDADRAEVQDAADLLIAGTWTRKPEVPSEGPISACHQLLLNVHLVMTACNTTAAAYGLPLEGTYAEAQLQTKLASAIRKIVASTSINPQDALKSMRRIGKHTIVALCKAGKTTAALKPKTKQAVQEYAFNCLMQQSKMVPQRQSAYVITLPDGTVVAEVASLLPMDTGLEYVRFQGDGYSDLAEFMTEFNRFHPSDAKKQWLVQAMAINARYHSINARRPDDDGSAGSGVAGVGNGAANGKAGDSSSPLFNGDDSSANGGGGGAVGGGASKKQLQLLERQQAAAAAPPGTTLQQRERQRLREQQQFEIYGCPRSGAFAVHGRKPKGIGLSQLTALQEQIAGGDVLSRRQALQRLGFDGPEALAKEVEVRSVLCVAQALPVVVASLQQMCGSPVHITSAYRTGKFLHVQQSLLSDLNANERSYLQDMVGALEVLAKRLVVRFLDASTSARVLPLQVNSIDGTITLHLSSELVRLPEGAPFTREQVIGRPYSLAVAVFNQGINALQSMGFVLASSSKETYQDTLNRQSLWRLNEYARQAGCASGPALAQLNAHYLPGAKRDPKDVESFWLIRRACREIGAGRAVNCKSGKDRTAMEIAISFAQEAVASGVVAEWMAAEITKRLHRGLSYAMTGQNNAQPNAYAFNEMELLTMPKRWAPDWKLCGKVKT